MEIGVRIGKEEAITEMVAKEAAKAEMLAKEKALAAIEKALAAKEKKLTIFNTNYHQADVSAINLEESARLFLKNEAIKLYGKVVSAQSMSNRISLLISDGKYLALNMSGEVIAYIDLFEYLPEFFVNKDIKNSASNPGWHPNIGISGGYWASETDLMIYHLSEFKNSESDKSQWNPKNHFEMSLTWLQIKNEEVSFVDRHTFGHLTKEDINALGGGMSIFDSGILLATGSTAIDFGTRSQDPLSNYGKLIWIDFEAVKTSRKFKDENFTILAKGLRNPYGIVTSNGKGYITDHGSSGGDNISEIVPGGNFGRNLYDYGRPYDKNLPLYSNKPDNFIEPLYYFSPAIAPSDISSCPFEDSLQGYGNCLVVSSLRAQSMFILKIQRMGDLQTPYVQSIEQIKLGERIRSIETVGNTVFLLTDLLNLYVVNYSKNFTI